MRILYVDDEPAWRGGQQQLLDLMESLGGRHHSVWLTAPDGAPLFRRAAGAGIPTFPLPASREVSPANLNAVGKLIDSCDCQIVHCNTPRSLFAAGAAARLHGRLVVASRRAAFALRSRVSAVKYGRLVNATVAVSKAIRDQLERDGVDTARVELIYDGIDLERIDSQSRTELEWGHCSGPLVATLAALTEEKGHATLLEAITLTTSGQNARWLMVGGGPLRVELGERVRTLGLQDKVLMTGFRPDAVSLLKSADVFCLPSLAEGLGSSVLEAMGCAQPVAASRTGGLPELVSEGETGLLAEPGNATDLAKILDRLLSDPPLRQRMGSAGRARVEHYFTRQRMVDETEALYRRLLGGTGIG